LRDSRKNDARTGTGYGPATAVGSRYQLQIKERFHGFGRAKKKLTSVFEETAVARISPVPCIPKLASLDAEAVVDLVHFLHFFFS
jgi:hypothetical protein